MKSFAAISSFCLRSSSAFAFCLAELILLCATFGPVLAMSAAWRFALSSACASLTARGIMIVCENPLSWQNCRASLTGSSPYRMSTRW